MGNTNAFQKANRQRSILLDKISEKLAGKVTFIGFIDGKADLLEYRKIKKVYHIPVERQESLNVQIALVTSLVKNWKDVFGQCKHMSYSSDDCDVIFLEALDSTLVAMAVPGTGPQVAKFIIQMISETSAV